MTNTEINIAIAEACGWKPKVLEMWNAEGKISHILDNRVPAYTNDLNAMHEAEKTLTVDNHQKYLTELYESAKPHNVIRNQLTYVCATASQRAEAFLRTIGKWKDA